MYTNNKVNANTEGLVALLDRRQRRGLTLIEVLMSIFVLAIGLFGVAALLPLGQKKMIEGAIDQRKAQVAESAFEYLGNQGGLNPTRWIDATGATYDAVRIAPAGRVLCSVAAGSNASSIVTTSPNISAANGAYNDSVLEFRSGRLRGVRRVVGIYNGNTKTFPLTTALPVAPDAGDTFVVFRTTPFAIDPQLVAKLGTNAGPFAQGMPRVSLSIAAGYNQPMPIGAAENLTSDDNDLIYGTPTGSDPPAQVYASEPYYDINNNGTCDAGEFNASLHDMNGNGTWDGPLKRKSDLNLSWVATVVPTYGCSTEQYRVAIAVFYKRPLEAVRIPGSNSIVGSEPIPMEVRFNTSGLGGGSALLRARSDSGAPQDELKPVRAGHWILVSSTNGREHRWYRLSSVGPAYQDTNNGGRWTRNVALAGADWNTNAVADQTPNAVYYPGVVGVFERTMQIESLPDTAN